MISLRAGSLIKKSRKRICRTFSGCPGKGASQHALLEAAQRLSRRKLLQALSEVLQNGLHHIGELLQLKKITACRTVGSGIQQHANMIIGGAAHATVSPPMLRRSLDSMRADKCGNMLIICCCSLKRSQQCRCRLSNLTKPFV